MRCREVAIIAISCLLVASCNIGGHTPSYAWGCDNGFIQEPTTTEPNSIEWDTVAGLVFVTYQFVDDRVLVVVYQLRDFLSEPESHPIFYIITDKRHISITYHDKVGEGRCYDITQY